MDLRILAGLLALAAGVPAAAGEQARPLVLTDVTGHTCRPLALGHARAEVLLFIAHDCPISNAYAPEMERIRRKYSSIGIQFYNVYVDAVLSATQARSHALDYGLGAKALLDPGHKLAARCGVQVTPEAVVLGAGQRRLYRGRIDDTYVSVAVRRTHPASHDLRAALDAVLHGRPVRPAETRAVGCLLSTFGT